MSDALYAARDTAGAAPGMRRRSGVKAWLRRRGRRGRRCPRGRQTPAAAARPGPSRPSSGRSRCRAPRGWPASTAAPPPAPAPQSRLHTRLVSAEALRMQRAAAPGDLQNACNAMRGSARRWIHREMDRTFGLGRVLLNIRVCGTEGRTGGTATRAWTSQCTCARVYAYGCRTSSVGVKVASGMHHRGQPPSPPPASLRHFSCRRSTGPAGFGATQAQLSTHTNSMLTGGRAVRLQ